MRCVTSSDKWSSKPHTHTRSNRTGKCLLSLSFSSCIIVLVVVVVFHVWNRKRIAVHRKCIKYCMVTTKHECAWPRLYVRRNSFLKERSRIDAKKAKKLRHKKSERRKAKSGNECIREGRKQFAAHFCHYHKYEFKWNNYTVVFFFFRHDLIIFLL